MESHQPQKSKFDTDSNHDHISNLPADIKERILLKLPIKEVVRTSVLSSKWNEFWTSIPDLVFKEPCTESNLVKLVDMVLIVHKGPIKKFKLVSNYACNEAIDRWMLILSRNGIRKLELRFNDENRCTIPQRLFSCLALQHVDLSGCVINVPRVFRGFRMLHSLTLSYFDVSGTSIEKLISNCPLLECLGLSDFLQEGCLRIHTPNLMHLYISGEFHDICLETPKLTSAYIDLDNKTGDYEYLGAPNIRKESNISHAFGQHSNIRKLDIRGEFTEYLSMGPKPVNKPAIFKQLTELFVHICLPDSTELATSLCLCQNAPNLEVLHMEFWEDDSIVDPVVEDLWGLKATEYSLFKRLRIVNIMYTRNLELSLLCTKGMLEFAKFVVRNAPVLDKLNVVNLEDVRLIFEMLDCCPKLSKKAEIVFVEKSDED